MARLERHFALALVLVLTASAAQAEPPRHARRETRLVEDGEGRRSLLDVVGTARAVELLASGTSEERIRGIERLGRIGTREARDALSDALNGGPILMDPRTRLAGARAVAPFALYEEARVALTAIASHSLDEDPSRALGRLARDTAVWALARAAAGEAIRPEAAGPDDGSGATFEERALTPLLAAVIAGGPLGDVAERALVEHPPRDLGAFVRGVATATIAEIRLLGRLGDPRAIPMLRRSLVREELPVKSAAALALARLGDWTPLPAARAWLADKRTEPARRSVAVEILLTLGLPEGPVSLASLLDDEATRADGLALLERWPSAASLPALERIVRSDATRERKNLALDRVIAIGGEAAVVILEAKLSDADTATTAAFGLATLATQKAQTDLVGALAASSGDARRLVLRALLARALRFADERAALLPPFEEAALSSEPADRALGVFALSLLGRPLGNIDVQKAAPEVTAAVVSAAACLGPSAVPPLVPLAERALARGLGPSPKEHDGDVQGRIDQAALALVLLGSRDVGTSSELLALAESGALASPEAAYRLASRDPMAMRSRLDALLLGTSPLVRAHVALGLGTSPSPDAAARLASAYTTESEPEVRRAIVRALSLRSESMRRSLLELAARLDPDDHVRSLARRALCGESLEPRWGHGREAGLLVLVSSEAQPSATTRLRIVRGRVESGFAPPSVSALDGVWLGFAPSGERLRPLVLANR